MGSRSSSPKNQAREEDSVKQLSQLLSNAGDHMGPNQVILDTATCLDKKLEVRRAGCLAQSLTAGCAHMPELLLPRQGCN